MVVELEIIQSKEKYIPRGMEDKFTICRVSHENGKKIKRYKNAHFFHAAVTEEFNADGQIIQQDIYDRFAKPAVTSIYSLATGNKKEITYRKDDKAIVVQLDEHDDEGAILAVTMQEDGQTIVEWNRAEEEAAKGTAAEKKHKANKNAIFGVIKRFNAGS